MHLKTVVNLFMIYISKFRIFCHIAIFFLSGLVDLKGLGIVCTAKSGVSQTCWAMTGLGLRGHHIFSVHGCHGTAGERR